MFVESLVTQAVKLAYDKWKESQTESLTLSDAAKIVLKTMQSDPTDNGIFVESSVLSDSDYSMTCLYHTNLEIRTTRRVMAELEAKGIAIVAQEDRDGFKNETVKLTHFGWVLNPDTGKVERAG